MNHLKRTHDYEDFIKTAIRKMEEEGILEHVLKDDKEKVDGTDAGGGDKSEANGSQADEEWEQDWTDDHDYNPAGKL